MDALIYQKTVDDKCAILDLGAFVLRRLNFPAVWDDVRIGAFLSFTTADDPNAVPVFESLATTGVPTNRFAFGLKTISSLASPGAEPLPGQPGCDFIGVSTLDGAPTAINQTYGPGGVEAVNYGYSEGADPTFNTALGSFGHIDTSATPNQATNYCTFFGIRIAKSGANIGVGFLPGVDTTSPTKDALRALLSTPVVGWTMAGGVYTTGFDVPDGLFIRAPFQTNRMRVHAYGYHVVQVE